jgi:DHA3 family macrolide efflux protein-like MFS transporter
VSATSCLKQSMSYTSLLRIKPFRDLWLGQAISQAGDSFYYVIFMYMVERITHNIAMVGVVGVMESLPYLAFGPYAGTLADRMDRRKIMLASDLISGFTLIAFAAVLYFRGSPPLFLLLGAPGIISAVRVFFMPAKAAAVPALVPVEVLPTANAFSMMTQSIMPMMGLALSATVLGIIYSKFPHWFFFTAVCVNGLSFFWSAFFIARLPAILPKREDVRDTRPLADFKEGLRFMRSRRDLIVITCLLTFFRLMLAPFFVVYVAANKLWFGGAPQPLAWWEFAFFAGMIASSWAVGRMNIRRPGIAFSFGLGGVGVGVAFMAGAHWMQQAFQAAGWPIQLLGVTIGFWVFAICNFMCGLSVPFADIPLNTYLQLSVPDAYRGRVNSVLQMTATGVMPIGMALGGFLVGSLGVVWMFALMGIGMAVACFAGLLDPGYRSLRLPDSNQHLLPETPPTGAID